MHKAGGNKSKAAKLLGVSRSVLYDKLKKYEQVL
ncbi:helix-turn-helix domain-containing protein [Alteribacillus sp. JSM 102045]